jgi:hypothetical protein
LRAWNSLFMSAFESFIHLVLILISDYTLKVSPGTRDSVSSRGHHRGLRDLSYGADPPGKRPTHDSAPGAGRGERECPWTGAMGTSQRGPAWESRGAKDRESQTRGEGCRLHVCIRVLWCIGWCISRPHQPLCRKSLPLMTSFRMKTTSSNNILVCILGCQSFLFHFSLFYVTWQFWSVVSVFMH